MTTNEKMKAYFRKDENKTLSLCCRICALLMVVIALLSITKVFKLQSYIVPAMVISIPILFLPTVFYDVLNREESIYKYISLFLIVLMSGFLYVLLSYHVVIMLIFPICLSILYCNKNSVIFVFITSLPVIVVSHLLAFKLHFVPDEPLDTLKSVWLYGILPRLIEYGIFFAIALMITNKTYNLITSLIDKNEELYKEQENIINSLCEMEEARTAETAMHVKRVKEYTKVICKKLNMSDEKVWMISTASMLHDIGKIIVPRAILCKPEPLSKEEFDIIKQHTENGYKMLEKSKGEVMKIAAMIAHEHHERYDGTGYPLNKKGNEISLEARCVAIADVFDALVSKRSYKKPWSLDDTRKEIVSLSGSQFDPELVKIFDDSFDEFKAIYDKYPDSHTSSSCES